MAAEPGAVKDPLTDAPTGGVGDSPRRPDGTFKVKGEFAYSSDLWMDGMLWGLTLRSPHPHARITRIDTARALAIPGVFAVLTHDDVPGTNAYGLELRDQPVLAFDRVRYQGEPVALVAADHPETARRALDLVEVEYEVLPPVTTPWRPCTGDRSVAPGRQRGPPRQGPPRRSGGQGRRRGDRRLRGRHAGPGLPRARSPASRCRPRTAASTSTSPPSGCTSTGTRSPPASACPREGAAHARRRRRRLRRPRGPVDAGPRLPAGAAHGAAGEDGLQPRGVVLRPRPPAPGADALRARRHPRRPARLRQGRDRARRRRLRLHLTGGRAPTPPRSRVGPVRRARTSRIDATARYTNNPPCGAMRGFGAVQACFAYESQMDRLAAALGLDPVELRLRNAMAAGRPCCPPARSSTRPAPVAELLAPRARPCRCRPTGGGRRT